MQYHNLQHKNISELIILVAMVSVGWGVAFVSLAKLLQVLPPMHLLAARWGITAALFLLLILTKRIRFPAQGQEEPRISFSGRIVRTLRLFHSGSLWRQDDVRIHQRHFRGDDPQHDDDSGDTALSSPGRS